MQPASLDEVAKRAGVSAATASRALSRPELVAEATRNRVMQAAKELGYRPNQLARSLRQRGSRTIGLIITDILNPFHATLAKGVQDAASRRDYTVLLFNSDEEPEKERRAIDTLRGHLPQGLIVVPTPKGRANLKLVGTLPVIELDRTTGRENAHTITVDNAGGARTAVQHLTSLGHTRIGMIVGQPTITTAQERLAGYRQALADAGIPYDPDLVLPGNHREEDGRAAATAMLSRADGKRPSALFVGNNEMTVGAVLAVRSLGLRIPEDLSIVGFDDSRWAQTMHPAITVVAQPEYELGMTACETLLNLIDRDGPSSPTRVQLGTTFVLRESTGPPGRSAAQPARHPPELRV